MAELCLLKAQLAQAIFFLFLLFPATSDASAELCLLEAQLALARLKCWLLLNVLARSIGTLSTSKAGAQVYLHLRRASEARKKPEFCFTSTKINLSFILLVQSNLSICFLVRNLSFASLVQKVT